MFNEYDIYNTHSKQEGSGKSKCQELKSNIDDELTASHMVRQIDEPIIQSKIEEYKKICGTGLKRSGEGLKRSGEGLKRSGEGLKRSGEGLKRSGEGLKRSGEGLLRAGSGIKKNIENKNIVIPDIEQEYIGGCYECQTISDIEKPKIGEELKKLMLIKYSK